MARGGCGGADVMTGAVAEEGGARVATEPEEVVTEELGDTIQMNRWFFQRR